MANLQLEAQLAGHSDWVTSIATTPAVDNMIVSSSRDKTVIVWEMKKDGTVGDDAFHIKNRIHGHGHFVSDVILSGDGKYALTACWDKMIRLWHLGRGKNMRIFKGHTKDVLSLSFSPDNRQIVSGGRDKMIRLWNTLGENKLTLPEKHGGHADWVSAVVYSPIEAKMLTAGWDKKIVVWNFSELNGIRCEAELYGHKGSINTVCISPDGSLAASGGKDGNVMLWDLKDNNHLYTLENTADVTKLDFSPNRYWLTGAVGNVVKVWDLEKRELVCEVKLDHCDHPQGTPTEVTTLKWMSDGQRLVVGYTDSFIRVFRVY
ncbi:hypothetical protein L596_026028 [Steinernema carpocapsae]|uniref:Small ribosomal subunit protein RACK1 n=1 Tax=Steinernema carpocapsae TaxID=34508 RepID=A0A4U5M035_STECR|nr:hypothetical protein L596_026028 [Steinernema carpocapsae]